DILTALGACSGPWCRLGEHALCWVWSFDTCRSGWATETFLVPEPGRACQGLYVHKIPSTNSYNFLQDVWNNIQESGGSQEVLVAFLHHLVGAGQKRGVSFDRKEKGTYAAAVYFLLLTVPGNHPYTSMKVCLLTFFYFLWLSAIYCKQLFLDRKRFRSAQLTENHRVGHISMPKAGLCSHSKRTAAVYTTTSSYQDCRSETEEEVLSPLNLQRLRKALEGALQALALLLQDFPLNDHPQCVSLLIKVWLENLIQVIKIHTWYENQNLACIMIYQLVTRTHAPHARPARTPLYTPSGLHRFCIMLRRCLFLIQVPDKAEYRMHAAQAVCQLLSCMNRSSYVEFMKWLHIFSCNAKCGYRVFSMDVLSVLLGEVEREADDTIPLENLKYFSHKFMLLQLVLRRCCDRAPMVRTRALAVLAQCLDSGRTTCLNSMQELLQGGEMLPLLVGKNDHITIHEILEMLQNRVGDEKLSVRKAALQVLVVLLCHELLPLNKSQLDLLQEHCRDPALSVRKQALQSLTQLLKMFPKSMPVQTCWLRSLLPAVLDVETSIQEKVLECFDTVIIGNIKSCGQQELEGPQCLAWSLLEILTLPKDLYLKKVCQMLMQRNTIPANLASFLLSHTDSERVASAWMLLAKVAAPGLRLNSHTVTVHLHCFYPQICHVFTLGEVAQLVSSHISKKIPLLIQFIIASPTLEMGKLCLQNEDIAKRGIAALVQELELSPHVPIRNNVVVVLCDLCMCYPALVDQHIPRITNCFKDKDPLIRRQTLILLTRLFQEEYLKWKGPLFYRFASVLVDKDPSIQRLAEFCLTNVLLKKQPAVIFQHFVECIFYFNNFEKYEKYRLTQSERELKLFAFKGEKHQETRMTIYRYLLNHLTDEQRFKLTTRLCNGTLGEFLSFAVFSMILLNVCMYVCMYVCIYIYIYICYEIRRFADRSVKGEGETEMETCGRRVLHFIYEEGKRGRDSERKGWGR
uniref:Non-SMC condensin II complex subunit D3 n=1 Tax=Eptatretus burgeri TaxID=7764 RepID=A0A8C4R3U0_EPTBU